MVEFSRNKKFRLLLSESGQTLVEVLVALSAAVVVIVAIAIAVSTSVTNSTATGNRQKATQYAQDGMELVRQVRDGDPQEFQNWVDNDPQGTPIDAEIYCLDGEGVRTEKSEVLNPCPPNIEDVYSREIIIDATNRSPDNSCITPTPLPGDQISPREVIEVTSKVVWHDNRCEGEEGSYEYYCHDVTISTCLSERNPIIR